MTPLGEARDGELVVLTPERDMDATVLPDYERRLEWLLGDGVTRVVWDLSRVGLLVSTAAGFLLQTSTRLRAAGGRMVLCGLSPRARGTLATMGVLDVFRIQPDVASAVAALR